MYCPICGRNLNIENTESKIVNDIEIIISQSFYCPKCVTLWKRENLNNLYQIYEIENK